MMGTAWPPTISVGVAIGVARTPGATPVGVGGLVAPKPVRYATTTPPGCAGAGEVNGTPAAFVIKVLPLPLPSTVKKAGATAASVIASGADGVPDTVTTMVVFPGDTSNGIGALICEGVTATMKPGFPPTVIDTADAVLPKFVP